MDVKDLRVGSYIYVNNDIYIVSQLYKQGAIYATSVVREFQLKKNYRDEFKPIPITEENLLDIGCKKVNNSMFRIRSFTLQGTTIDDGGDINNRIITQRKGWKICFNGNFLCNKEFLHEFQNLYYDVYKEEI